MINTVVIPNSIEILCYNLVTITVYHFRQLLLQSVAKNLNVIIFGHNVCFSLQIQEENTD